MVWWLKYGKYQVSKVEKTMLAKWDIFKFCKQQIKDNRKCTNFRNSFV